MRHWMSSFCLPLQGNEVWSEFDHPRDSSSSPKIGMNPTFLE
jgi:hypothetical protein